MKYTVTAYIGEDKEYKTNVNVRTGAKKSTVFQKCMNKIGQELIDHKEIQEDTKYLYDLPNIWTNGYVGAAWFINPFINVTIQEANGAWLAM